MSAEAGTLDFAALKACMLCRNEEMNDVSRNSTKYTRIINRESHLLGFNVWLAMKT